MKKRDLSPATDFQFDCFKSLNPQDGSGNHSNQFAASNFNPPNVCYNSTIQNSTQAVYVSAPAESCTNTDDSCFRGNEQSSCAFANESRSNYLEQIEDNLQNKLMNDILEEKDEPAQRISESSNSMSDEEANLASLDFTFDEEVLVKTATSLANYVNKNETQKESPPTKIENRKTKKTKKTYPNGKPRLYNFLLEMLESEHPCIKWLEKEKGLFKFEDSVEVARLWGGRKNKPDMKYENFARSLRTYIKKGILKKPRTKLVYCFAQPV